MKIKRYSLSQAQEDLPSKPLDADKTMAGRTLVIGGSTGLWGAPILAARAASRVGSGYVYLCTPEKKFPIAEHPDLLFVPKNDKLNLSVFDSIALGPGFDRRHSIRSWLRKISKLEFKRVVLDAGALRAIAMIKPPPQFSKNWILTPHEGELAELIGIAANEIHHQREHYLTFAQQVFGGVIVLKGPQTLVTDGQDIWEIDSGNQSLAKAGTGDVLTGMIAGLLAQGLTPLKAACLGAFVHGSIADDWVSTGNDIVSLSPLDLLEMLPRILARLRNNATERKTERNPHRGSWSRDLQTER